nr:MAG TPA: hypothetical protein [Bacteriophage sp.]
MWSYFGNLNFVGGSSPEILPITRCTRPGILSGPRFCLIFLSGLDYIITISNDLGVGHYIWLLRAL